MVLDPKKSGEYISKNAKYLTVNTKGVDDLVEMVIVGMKKKEIDISNLIQNSSYPKPSDPNVFNWILFLNTITFGLWRNDKWIIERKRGHFALCAAINRAMRNGIDLTNPNFFSSISCSDVERIFKADNKNGVFALIDEKVKCLNEVGKILVEKYDGNFENCVKQCGNSARKLLELITSEFPCFRDETMYAGKRVSFQMKAQALIIDIWACFQGEGLGRFTDLETISMCANYRVPQVLVFAGALDYSSELKEALAAETVLEYGCGMEVEIRGASIHIVELIRAKVEKIINEEHAELRSCKINSILIDNFLWNYRRNKAKKLYVFPFHRTISVFY